MRSATRLATRPATDEPSGLIRIGTGNGGGGDPVTQADEVVADFKNGSYTADAQSVTVDQLFWNDPGYGGNFSGAVIEPGVGMVIVSDEERTVAAVLPDLAGYLCGQNFYMLVEGSTSGESGWGFETYNEPDFEQYMGLDVGYLNDPGAYNATVSIYEPSSTSDTEFASNSAPGAFKTALIVQDDAIFASVNGSAVATDSSGLTPNIRDRIAIYLNGLMADNPVIEKITISTTLPDTGDLPVLSA